VHVNSGLAHSCVMCEFVPAPRYLNVPLCCCLVDARVVGVGLVFGLSAGSARCRLALARWPLSAVARIAPPRPALPRRSDPISDTAPRSHPTTTRPPTDKQPDSGEPHTAHCCSPHALAPLATQPTLGRPTDRPQLGPRPHACRAVAVSASQSISQPATSPTRPPPHPLAQVRHTRMARSTGTG